MISAIKYIKNADIQALDEALSFVAASNASSVLIFGCDKDNWGTAHDSWLRSAKVQTYSMPIFGGVFPYVLHKGSSHENGTLVIGLNHTPPIHIIKNMSANTEWNTELAVFSKTLGMPTTLLTFIDGLSENIERITEHLYSVLGESVKTIGCGAGSLDFEPKPCVISSEGLLQDVTLIAAIDKECSMGVTHGWEILAGPFLVTQAEKNSIVTLNYQPALDIYQQAIEARSNVEFSQAPFFEISKTFPFGISSIDGELLVRDPIAVNDKTILCVGEVPQNSSVYLLRGKPELLIASAGEAAKKAMEARQDETSPSTAIIIDCISRSLFLEDEFTRELDSIESELPDNCTSIGALTLGEICTTESGPVALLNKSTVIALF
jgi:hypothetical protein